MLEHLNPHNLIIGPRPGKKSFDRLAELNLTHCCTLLSEKEEPANVQKISNRLGCEWIWLPVTGGGLDALKATPMRDHVQTMREAIANTDAPKIYLHCSAGLHRTGYVGYILLRLMGLEAAAALCALRELRAITAEEVGEERIALAESFVQSLDIEHA